MKVLLIGSGGREHAMAWHLKKDPRVRDLFISPGNAGTAQLGKNLAIPVSDLPALLAWAEREKPDLTLVGPEAPLCAGIVDLFREKGLPIFGPDRKAAQLEGSKVFTKRFFQRHGIPTAPGACFSDPVEAYRHSQGQPYPQVIKADGLAAGKGVVIARHPAEAAMAIFRIMERRVFGEAGAQVVIEECLTGPEVSFLAVTDGQTLQLLPLAQDHKRVGDGDTGANTGGMGAYAPARFLGDAARQDIIDRILYPILEGLRREGIDYQGILYAGLILSPAGPQHAGDQLPPGRPGNAGRAPSFGNLAPRHRARPWPGGTSPTLPLRFNDLSAVGIVLAAPGYPEAPRLGDPIEGLDQPPSHGDRFLFHAGTQRRGNRILTSGGRVATATAWHRDFETARRAAYEAAGTVRFPGAVLRRDIGARAGVAA